MRDLRLLPAGVATWLVCALGVASTPGVLIGVAVSGSGVVVGLALLARRWMGQRVGGGGWAARVGGGAGTACLAACAVVIVCCSCAAQLHQRGAGLLAALTADRATVTVVGTVRAEAAAVASPGAEQRIRTVVAVEHVSGRGRSGRAAAGVLVLGDAGWDIAYGARVELTGRLSPSEPGDEVVAVLVASGPPAVLSPPGGVDRAVAGIRQGLLDVADRLGPDARGLVPGTAVGDTSRLPPDLDQAMRDVSLTHVTAVSGAHFAVLSVAVLGLTGLLRLPRWARALGTAAVMAGFVVLVHPEPSVVRAGVMGALAVIGMVIGRPSRAVPALGTAVVLLLILDPWLARSFGFVLSVLATGAIALLGPPVAARLGRVLPRWLAVAVAVPLAAQAVCAPVLVLFQPGVSVYAVPANVLAAPALVPATVLGVAGAVTAPWCPGLAGALVHGAAVGTWWIATVARGAAALAGSRVGWPEGTAGAVGLALLTTAAVAAGLTVHRWPARAWRLAAGLMVGAVLLVVALREMPRGEVPADWEVVQCDVGQGDALVVRSGPSAAVVVDVGPDGRAADACLDGLGIDRIDLLVLTHHHADHVGGLGPVLAGRTVERALVSPVAQPDASAAAALGALADAGVPVLVAAVDGVVEVAVEGRPTAGASAAVGGTTVTEADLGPPVRAGWAGQVHWTVLSPSSWALSVDDPAWSALDPTGDDRAWSARGPRRAPEMSGSRINDASVVLLLRAPTLTVLALGDAELDAQEAVARGLERIPGGWRVDVVKVAHHGSGVQSERLIERVRPAVALISVGADNDYGHPAPQTLDRLRDAGALVLSTHECGAIAVASGPGPGPESAPAPMPDGGPRGLRVSAACVGGD